MATAFTPFRTSSFSSFLTPSSTGEIYQGEWKEGIRHGQGRRHYPDGSIYEGGWERDKKHGPARMLLPHGTIVCFACPHYI